MDGSVFWPDGGSEARIAFNVSRQAFFPPPNVTSSVVLLRPRAVEAQPTVRQVEHITRAAFGQRRKMLRQSLKAAGVDVESLLRVAGAQR
jgi:16S rRNA (adenine1518-N6/adenine1519-N6)-dimethyltransferase